MMASASKPAYTRVQRSSVRVGDPVVCIVAREAERRERLTAILTASGLEVAGRAWDVEGLVLDRADEPTVVVHSSETAERPAPLRRVSERFPEARIVVVIPRATRQTARKAMAAGAVGLVEEADVERLLCLVVRSVAAGQLSIPIVLAEGLERPVLSSREKQVLRMVVMGSTNAEVARGLFLAESTVKSHLSSIFGKLGVRSRAEAAALVLDPDSGLGIGLFAVSENGAAEHPEHAPEFQV